MLGLHSFDENQAFVLLQVDSYETAYAAMLSWESNMQSDLLPFFTRTPSPNVQNTTTATSSTPTPAMPTDFVDKTLENHDTRTLYDAEGNIKLLWTFLDRNLILITTNQYTLREVVARLNVTPQ